MNPEYVDIHAHVNFASYDEDREAVLARAKEAKTWIINVGSEKSTSESALALAQGREGVFASIGLHPVHTGATHYDESEFGPKQEKVSRKPEEFDYDFYKKLAQDPKVVAIGECGLDYFHLAEESKEKQKEVFIRQIELANEVGKPLMLHIREAYKDALEILKKHTKVKSNAHFFAGNWQEAKQFLDLGFTLSFTGVITFARNYDEVIKNAPLDMIMSETDCPYVTPVPYRGKRNEPAYVSEVVKKIAEIRGEPFEKVKQALVTNAINFFHLK